PHVGHPVLVPVTLRPGAAEAEELHQRAVALPEHHVDAAAVEDAEGAGRADQQVVIVVGYGHGEHVDAVVDEHLDPGAVLELQAGCGRPPGRGRGTRRPAAGPAMASGPGAAPAARAPGRSA